MRYEDRKPDEGANTPGRHPLREFFKLSVMAVIAVIVLGILLRVAGATLGGLIPFKAELWLAERIDSAATNSGQESPFQQINTNPELQEYLQSVADRVAVALELPQSMPVTLHYSDENVVNAYATIGGHVYFFKGLLTLLPHENALAMLVAHEYSHVTLRHPAEGLGGGLALALGTSMIGLSSENQLFSLGTTLTSTGFSRNMETEADRSALAAVNAMYGHVNGAGSLFELFMLQRQQDRNDGFEKFVSTHPLDQERIDQISELAIENNWLTKGQITPLPDQYKEWLLR